MGHFLGPRHGGRHTQGGEFSHAGSGSFTHADLAPRRRWAVRSTPEPSLQGPRCTTIWMVGFEPVAPPSVQSGEHALCERVPGLTLLHHDLTKAARLQCQGVKARFTDPDDLPTGVQEHSCLRCVALLPLRSVMPIGAVVFNDQLLVRDHHVGPRSTAGQPDRLQMWANADSQSH